MCGESKFDIFEAKKCFPDSGKVCVLKRKVAKCVMRKRKNAIFILKTTSLGGKNVRFVGDNPSNSLPLVQVDPKKTLFFPGMALLEYIRLLTR